MPAVISTEKDLVPARCSTRDTNRDGARLAAALGISNHLGTGDRANKFLSKLNFEFVIDGCRHDAIDLFMERLIDDRVGLNQDDRADAADPVDILVAVDVPEPCPLRTLGIDRRDAISVARRSSANQLRAPWNELKRPLV